MGMTLLGRKVGMTRVYTEGGVLTPVTVIALGPCTVTQVKSAEKDGYAGVQVGFDDVKPRRSTIPVIGHDAKAGTTPKRFHREFRVEAGQESGYTLGQVLTVKELEGQKYVDVTGTSKGKGFAGVMKRWGFKGQYASHGTERKHRSPGSIGSLCSNRGFGGGLAKGKRMAGHLGDERVTIRSVDVVRIDADRNLLLVKGAVPGANNGMVMVRPAVRLNKSKQKKVAGKGE
ncbi:MAG: 50S ribosomal protein L3 [Phycisphaerae bacterium]|nr:50S ribosomal protein L3 [Phycisphaerae bacterium]